MSLKVNVRAGQDEMENFGLKKCVTQAHQRNMRN